MATVSIASLGLGNADLTVIGKLSETGLSQIEVADAVVEGDKLKKGNITAGQVGAYTKAEVEALVAGGTDLSDYYNKAQVDNLISAIPETDLSNYYNKTEVYNKLESYSKAEVDALITGGGADLSDYYTKAQVDSLIGAIPETDLSNYYNKTQVDSLIDAIPETDLTNYYNKTQVDSLIPDISTKQDTLVSATNIKTINGQSVLGSGDLVISGGGAVDLSEYYKKTETYSKVEVDTKIADIPETDLSNYYDKTETETLLSNKIDKGVGVVGATKTKITYNNDGIITGGADLVEADLPNISQAKVTNLVSDLSNKQSSLISGTNIKTINGQSVLGSGDLVISLVGDKGDTGNGIVNILFTSTTDTSGLAGQSGATDTYTITYSDTTTDIIQTYNGVDGGVKSVAGRAGNVILTEADITDIDKYTKAEVDAKINAKHSTAFLMAYSN